MVAALGCRKETWVGFQAANKPAAICTAVHGSAILYERMHCVGSGRPGTLKGSMAGDVTKPFESRYHMAGTARWQQG